MLAILNGLKIKIRLVIMMTTIIVFFFKELNKKNWLVNKQNLGKSRRVANTYKILWPGVQINRVCCSYPCSELGGNLNSHLSLFTNISNLP